MQIPICTCDDLEVLTGIPRSVVGFNNKHIHNALIKHTGSSTNNINYYLNVQTRLDIPQWDDTELKRLDNVLYKSHTVCTLQTYKTIKKLLFYDASVSGLETCIFKN